tara:strand:- start:1091 stop:1273 length:183 start_codon:yes stop_codon:yes gene_type:complete
MTLLIILWFTGYNMTIDVEQLYGIKTMDRCGLIIESVIQEYGANEGACFEGNIHKKLEGA